MSEYLKCPYCSELEYLEDDFYESDVELTHTCVACGKEFLYDVKVTVEIDCYESSEYINEALWGLPFEERRKAIFERYMCLRLNTQGQFLYNNMWCVTNGYVAVMYDKQISDIPVITLEKFDISNDIVATSEKTFTREELLKYSKEVVRDDLKIFLHLLPEYENITFKLGERGIIAKGDSVVGVIIGECK